MRHMADEKARQAAAEKVQLEVEKEARRAEETAQREAAEQRYPRPEGGRAAPLPTLGPVHSEAGGDSATRRQLGEAGLATCQR